MYDIGSIACIVGVLRVTYVTYASWEVIIQNDIFSLTITHIINLEFFKWSCDKNRPVCQPYNAHHVSKQGVLSPRTQSIFPCPLQLSYDFNFPTVRVLSENRSKSFWCAYSVKCSTYIRICSYRSSTNVVSLEECVFGMFLMCKQSIVSSWGRRGNVKNKDYLTT